MQIKFPICNDFENFFKSNVDRHFYQNEIAENGMIFNNENEMQIYIEKIDNFNEIGCEYRISKTKDEITIFGKNHQKCVFYYVLIPKIASEKNFLTDKCKIKYQNCPENCFNCKTKEKCEKCHSNFALDDNNKCLCNKSLNLWISFKENNTEKCISPNNNVQEQQCLISPYLYLNTYTNECVENCNEIENDLNENYKYSMKKVGFECKCSGTKNIHWKNKCYSPTEFKNIKIAYFDGAKTIDCSKLGQFNFKNKCVSSCENEDTNYHPINGYCISCNNQYISLEGTCVECDETSELKYEEKIEEKNEEKTDEKNEDSNSNSYDSSSNENSDSNENEQYPKKYCFKEKCPQTHPIQKENSCEDYCDTNEVEYNNTCFEQCPKGTYKFKQRCICNRTESLWYYENEEGFIYIVCNETLEQCPSFKPFKITKTNECVENCPEEFPFKYQQTCIDKCEPPYEYYIEVNKTCAVDCVNLFIENNTKTCYEKCPENLPFIYEEDGISYCIKECNENYGYFIKNDNYCYSNCPSTHSFKLENTNECIKNCPNDHPNLVVLDNLTESETQTYKNRCYKYCPDGHNLTVKNISNSCFTFCPEKFPYREYNSEFCYDECPKINYVLLVDDNLCSYACPLERYTSIDVIKNKTYCFINCPDSNSVYNFYYKNEYYKTCVSTCANDPNFPYLIKKHLKCEKNCTEDSPYEIYNQKQCYSNCTLTEEHKYTIEYAKKCVKKCDIDDIYIYHLVEKKLCADNCTKEYPLLEPINKECYNKCPSNYSYLLPKDNTCIKECPPHYISNNSICIIVTEYVQDENIDNEDKLDAIAKNLAYLSDELSVITLESGKTVEVVSSGRKVEYDNLSSIDLSECEAILRETYSIPPDEDLLILKIDTVTTTSVKNEVNYEVYAKNGTKLNLDPCSKVTVSISSPITNPEALKLDLAKDLEKEGVDIYNTDGEFYNNYCFSYSSGGNDMTLNDRYSNIYPDVDVCESGCVYNGINMTTNKISCNCNPTNFTENSGENEEKIDGKKFFLNLKNYFNYKLFSCFDYILHFKKKYILNNFGFWFSLIIISLEFVCFFLCVFFLISYVRKKVVDNFDESLKSRLKSLKIRKANKIFVKKKKKIALVKTNHFDISSARMINQKNILKSNKIIESEEDFSNEAFSEMPFETAIKKDTRNVLKIIVTLIFAKLEFFKILFFKEEYEFYPLLISVYLMSLHLDFSLNALLYSDDVVSQKYNNGGSLNFVTILGLGFFANFIGNIICKSLEKLTLYNFPLEGLVKEVKDKKKFKLLEKMIKIIKKRLAMFFALQFVLTMLCSYYLYVFCNVYGASQVSLFVNYVTGIAQSLFISVGIAVGIAIARYFGLKLKIKYLYYFSRLVDQQYE